MHGTVQLAAVEAGMTRKGRAEAFVACHSASDLQLPQPAQFSRNSAELHIVLMLPLSLLQVQCLRALPLLPIRRLHLRPSGPPGGSLLASPWHSAGVQAAAWVSKAGKCPVQVQL